LFFLKTQAASLMSFDSLIGSSGGVVIQPVLGRAADVWGYSFSYVASALFQMMAVPFLVLARRQDLPCDRVKEADAPLQDSSG
jgi:hypothetical protein